MNPYEQALAAVQEFFPNAQLYGHDGENEPPTGIIFNPSE